MLKEIQEQTNRAVKELCELARLKRGDLMVVAVPPVRWREKGLEPVPSRKLPLLFGKGCILF